MCADTWFALTLSALNSGLASPGVDTNEEKQRRLKSVVHETKVALCRCSLERNSSPAYKRPLWDLLGPLFWAGPKESNKCLSRTSLLPNPVQVPLIGTAEFPIP